MEDMQCLGTIFRIQRFSLHDGDGIRTTVFLSTCPLSCLWCHNPECRENTAETIQVSAEKVIQEVKKDLPFYRQSGGGITLSGGEPSAQPEFSLAMLRLAQSDGISGAMETAGTGERAFYHACAAMKTAFLYDLKVIDTERHRTLCGKSNEKILENLQNLFSLGADVTVRMPLVPGYNDTEADLSAMADYLGSNAGKYRFLELMPFHDIARGKYEKLHREMIVDRPAATLEEINRAQSYFVSRGIPTRVSGT